MSSFWWYFFNIWPFIYWTLNKPSLETWTCVCCYCAYGLFLCFRSLWNSSWKRQEIWGGSRTVRCRSQWVKEIKFSTFFCWCPTKICFGQPGWCLTTTYVLLKETNICSPGHPFQKLLLKQFTRNFMHWVTEVHFHDAFILALKIKTRPPMASFGNGQPNCKTGNLPSSLPLQCWSQTLLTILGALGIYLSFHGEKACKKLDMTKFTNLQKSKRKAQPTQKPQRLGMSSYWQFQFCVTSEGAGTKVCHAGCMQVYPYCHLGHAPVYCHYC